MDKINHCLNHNRFIPIDSEELSALELMGKMVTKTNELVETSNTMAIDLSERVTKTELKQTRKLDETGNFTGTWFGVKHPVMSEPGIQGQVIKNIEDIDTLKEKTSTLENKLKKSIEFERLLNCQKPLIKLPVKVGTEFMQGFAINQSANELYIARQINGGTKVTIYVYNLDNLSLKSSKSYTKTTGAYQEGLPYFYNSIGQLCFMVRTAYDKKLSIFNYETGNLSAEMEVIGGSKLGMDSKRRYLISGYGSADRLEGINVYDFESITLFSPKLITSIVLDGSISDGEKTQGITIIDDKIVLGRGKTKPMLTVLNLDGTILNTTSIKIESLRTQLQSFVLGDVNGEYENEGVCFYQYEGQELGLVSHVFGDYVYLSAFGSIDFEELSEYIYSENNTNGLLWKDVTFNTGVSNYGVDVKVQYAKDKNGFVHLRGVCTHTNLGATPNLKLFNLPFPYRPDRNCFAIGTASGGADRINKFQISTNGDVTLKNTTAVSDTPFTCLDNIRFYSIGSN